MHDNDTKCAAFWNHTNLRGGDRIFPCCRFKTPVGKFDGDLKNILHSDKYEKLRNTDVSTLWDCSKCMLEEANGKKSLRQTFNEQYTFDEVKLKYLEIGFDNICNLTCDGCWGEWSSAWAKKENKLYYTELSDINKVPTDLEKLVFLGGEPLQTNKHVRFLERLENLSDINLVYYTNGMFLIKDIELLKQAKSVNMILSIDAVGELNEQVRTGSNWKQILKFINQVKELDFKLSIHSVLHSNSWPGIADLEKFVKSLNVEWEVNPLTFPEKLDMRKSPNKKDIVDLIQTTSIPNKEYILNFLQ
jgi:molybdenum cofactor biosynthesis enzyme MoaA